MPSASRTFLFLGTGTSLGVPMVGCECAVCQSDHPRNWRTRCAVVIQTAQGNILIDTPPELRMQLLRERILRVHALVFTHAHADHLFGLDDVRPFPKYLNAALPVYCTEEVENAVRHTFHYAFDSKTSGLPPGYLPKLTFERIGDEPFGVLGERFVPIPLIHGRFNVLGFRIDDIAYCTDVNRIPETSWSRLLGVRILVIDALRFKPHPTHFSLNEALDVIARLKPERAFITHTSHEFDYEATNRLLPPGVELAYDGLRFEF